MVSNLRSPVGFGFPPLLPLPATGEGQGGGWQGWVPRVYSAARGGRASNALAGIYCHAERAPGNYVAR